jgi:hypothetical protein
MYHLTTVWGNIGLTPAGIIQAQVPPEPDTFGFSRYCSIVECDCLWICTKHEDSPVTSLLIAA